ncbi:hypothetical protein QBC42DRAFT_316047 [Cladorrhinum samala]|uniref:Uncharacterized protein n=1 Tax=Cladorrhinum samala TaxID=585594 RepID=A0AAV9HBA6_9PEZI|nr:hypothetical protein QBC42DRAFT_316047 [Cladorrhinum samala]
MAPHDERLTATVNISKQLAREQHDLWLAYISPEIIDIFAQVHSESSRRLSELFVSRTTLMRSHFTANLNPATAHLLHGAIPRSQQFTKLWYKYHTSSLERDLGLPLISIPDWSPDDFSAAAVFGDDENRPPSATVPYTAGEQEHEEAQAPLRTIVARARNMKRSLAPSPSSSGQPGPSKRRRSNSTVIPESDSESSYRPSLSPETPSPRPTAGVRVITRSRVRPAAAFTSSHFTPIPTPQPET